MTEISLNAVQKMYGANSVLDNITFQIENGARVGIVGRNGCGKTTVLKIIAGIETCDQGSRAIRKEATIGYLDQIPEYPLNFTVRDVLQQAFCKQSGLLANMRAVEKQLQQPTADSNKLLALYVRLQDEYEACGGPETAENFSRVCAGLKFDDAFLAQSFAVLSGGEKTRVVLAKILLQQPDVLLLDEPTNHLDADSCEWLESYLAKYRGTIIAVSHDRWFLDRTVRQVIDIERGRAESYEGNYSAYATAKKLRQEQQQAQYEQQQNTIKRLETAARDLREWGRRADNEKFFKRAVNIERRIERMEKVERPAQQADSIRNSFAGVKNQSTEVLRCEALCKSFGDNRVLERLDFLLRSGEQVALVGKNGCGKTTLLKIVNGEQEPDSGLARLSAPEVLYLEQNVCFEDNRYTVLEEFRRRIAVPEGQARHILAGFGFRKDDVFKKLEGLSGGEKSRLRLCILMQRPAGLLLLDEPTNHLDIATRELLEEKLLEFSGTILFVSHDRYFINLLATRVAELSNGGITEYCGNYEYYLEKRQAAATDDGDRERAARPGKGKVTARKEPGKRNEHKLRQLEEEIAALEQAIRETGLRMSVYVTDYSMLAQLQAERNEQEQHLERLMEQWLEAGAER